MGGFAGNRYRPRKPKKKRITNLNRPSSAFSKVDIICHNMAMATSVSKLIAVTTRWAAKEGF